MIVMPSNVTSPEVRRYADRFPGLIQNLIGPGGWRTPPLPYALDNGAHGAWINKEPWDEAAFLAFCDRAAVHVEQPRWVAVPDVVSDWPATLRNWETWAPRLRRLYGWPLALCVQDGATPEAVKAHTDPAIIFVGGTKRFKWREFRLWCGTFPRVHVGKCNRVEWALDCASKGVESIDGTGWMKTNRQRRGLVRILEYLTKQDHPPAELGVEAA